LYFPAFDISLLTSRVISFILLLVSNLQKIGTVIILFAFIRLLIFMLTDKFKYRVCARLSGASFAYSCLYSIFFPAFRA